MPERTVLHWAPVLQREQPRGELDLTWRWKVVVGRAKDCEVVLNHPSIPPRHGHFARLQNTWLVENYDTAHGIYVRGKRIMFEAVRDDEIDFSMLIRFRFERIAIGEEEAGLRAAIRAAPTDDSRYLVYADWLLEQNDALGPLMVSAAPVDARWLGPLGGEGIAVMWRHGFFQTVKVRSSKSVFPKAGVFSEVLLHPLAAFLLGLEVDAVLLHQESPAISAENWVDWLFEALLLQPPPTLRQLKVRLPRDQGLRFEGEFKALKAKLPQLETTFDRLFTEGALA
ncbi:MAG: Inner rane component of cytoplasmic domain [Myxococcaceae bacterium]|nr:Inner rane component of cytoplasmic domain [Myxococcaceae bacterium]